MKQPIRYFSIGLIFAGILLFVVYNFFDEPEAALEDIEIDTLIATIKDHGYYVMDESDFIKLSVLQDSLNEAEEDDPTTEENEEEADSDKDQNEEEENDSEEVEEEPEEDEEVEEATAITYTITIEPDMLPSDVTNILEQQQIISDARAFNQFLENEDYSRYIQIGTFEVSSDMDDHELAQALTQ